MWRRFRGRVQKRARGSTASANRISPSSLDQETPIAEAKLSWWSPKTQLRWLVGQKMWGHLGKHQLWVQKETPALVIKDMNIQIFTFTHSAVSCSDILQLKTTQTVCKPLCNLGNKSLLWVNAKTESKQKYYNFLVPLKAKCPDLIKSHTHPQASSSF